MIAIIDYGMGNLKSVYQAISEVNNALQHKQEIIITADKAKIDSADKIIFPGQGAMPDCMQEIEKLNLKQTIINAAKNKPFLGICLGFQMLFTHSQEGNVDGLNIFAGKVVRFENNDSEKLKIPHMGWNNIRYVNGGCRLFNTIPENTNFYFVHSYIIQPDDSSIIKGVADYGVEVPSCIQSKNIYAFQFHPEKSGAYGLRLLENFCTLKGETIC